MTDTILEVKNLSTHFLTRAGLIKAADEVSFKINSGSTLALVGESGSGKSITSLSIMRLVPPPGKITQGEIIFDGRDLMKLDDDKMRRLRGREIAMIFQDPMTSLNPVYTVGDQIAEAIELHERAPRKQAWRKAVEMMKRVRIPDAERRAKDYPHQLSGGMRQRVMIAIALSCNPKLLIADEPTTALDVTVEKQILELMMQMKDELGLSIIMITHNLPVALNYCDRILVMYAGKAMEAGTAVQLVSRPSHPYTRALFSSNLEIGKRGTRVESIKGNIPPLTRLPAGCRFHPRCAYATDKCRDEEPLLKQLVESTAGVPSEPSPG